jgi:hypothetical protein
MVPKVFIKYCSRFSYLKNLNILKIGISRSFASMTEYHPDLAKCGDLFTKLGCEGICICIMP